MNYLWKELHITCDKVSGSASDKKLNQKPES